MKRLDYGGPSPTAIALSPGPAGRVVREGFLGVSGRFAVPLKSEVTKGKYGFVIVKNGDGSFNREYKITGAELATLHASGNGLPPGVTSEEWTSGRAIVIGKDYDVGDCRNAGGRLKAKIAERTVNGRIVETFIELEAGEWSGTAPNVAITTQALTDLSDPVRKATMQEKGILPPFDITHLKDGILGYD